MLGDKEVLNGNRMRFRDEFVRHKILDAVGDISLVGYPIYGHIIANKSGHTLHIKLLKKILSCRDSWEFVSETATMPVASGMAVQI